MLVDFSPVFANTIKLHDFCQPFTFDDLKNATNASLDWIESIIDGLNDEQITRVPYDPTANDPYAATEEEKHIGWSVGHLVAHMCASSEEGAATAAIMARGIVYPREPRLRTEVPWQDITTRAHVDQILAQSRRMRLGYLQTFPDSPVWETTQELSERALELWGKLDVKTRFMLGLYHEWQHYDQLREVARQAREAISAASGKR